MKTYERQPTFQFFLTMVNCINTSAQAARMAVNLFSYDDPTVRVIDQRVEHILEEYLLWLNDSFI